MEVSFRHYILTRFNLPLYEQDKFRRPTQTEEWLDRRFELFEKYTLPSVAVQTCKNFCWICFFSDRTSEKYRERISKYSEICENFTPVFYSDEQTAEMSSSLIITLAALSADTLHHDKKQNHKDSLLLVTTNLDNDDSLHKDSVRFIQQNIRNDRERTLYSIPCGYQYFEKGRFILRMNDRSNHFLTVAEPYDDNLQTVLAYRHTRATKQLPVVYLKSRVPFWLEIVHDNNVSNDLRINIKIKNSVVLHRVDLQDYGLSISTGTGRQIIMSLFYYPYIWLATAVKKLIYKRRRKKEFGK